MSDNNEIFSMLGMEKLMKKYGAERVSEDSKLLMKRLLERYAMRLTQKSLKMVKHAGRITVRAKDMKAVLRRV